MSNHATGRNGVIIYDGSCGACSAFIGRRKAFFEKYGFTVVPYQEGWVRELAGLEQATLSQAIHLRTGEGELFRGLDVLQYVASKVWWLVPVSFFFGLRFLNPPSSDCTNVLRSGGTRYQQFVDYNPRLFTSEGRTATLFTPSARYFCAIKEIWRPTPQHSADSEGGMNSLPRN